MIKLTVGIKKSVEQMAPDVTPTAFLEMFLSSSSVRASMNSLLRLGKLACDMKIVVLSRQVLEDS